jgi:hypothetical protein
MKENDKNIFTHTFDEFHSKHVFSSDCRYFKNTNVWLCEYTDNNLINETTVNLCYNGQVKSFYIVYMKPITTYDPITYFSDDRMRYKEICIWIDMLAISNEARF